MNDSSAGSKKGSRSFKGLRYRKKKHDSDTYPGEETFKGGLIRYKIKKRRHIESSAPSEDEPQVELTFSEKLRDLFGRFLIYGKRMLPKLGLRDLMSTSCWRAALIEMIGNAQFTFFSCASVVAAITFKYDPPPQAIAIINIPLLAFYIFACAAPSGGHLNPLITFATVLTRLCTVCRGVMYITAQMIGAIIGSLLLRAVLSEDVANQTLLGGCFIGTEMGEGRAFVSEAIFSFGQLFIAFGTVLDPRQSQIFGPVVAPFFVSITVSMFIFLSSSMFAGYSGAGMNPSRCIAPSIALGDNLDHVWIYIAGPFVAAVLLAILYNLVPPHHKSIYKEYREKRRATRAKIKEERMKKMKPMAGEGDGQEEDYATDEEQPKSSSNTSDSSEVTDDKNE